jgi:FkbM family methyltransferase
MSAGLGGHIRGRKRLRRMRALYASFVGPGDLCFDVGANVGERVEVLRGVGASVVAIEPQPACVDMLLQRFGNDPEVSVLAVGLAESEGSRELRTASASTLSSMSPDWIESVRSSGRFAEFSWGETVEVPVRTLESVIQEYGRPRFCKIDVEGYERYVLEGLETPIAALSFEYAHEARDNAIACMTRLAALGEYEFCFSSGESMDLSDGWLSVDAQRERLEVLSDSLAWGDVYARRRATKFDSTKISARTS